jgi:hypothetical protein
MVFAGIFIVLVPAQLSVLRHAWMLPTEAVQGELPPSVVQTRGRLFLPLWAFPFCENSTRGSAESRRGLPLF